LKASSGGTLRPVARTSSEGQDRFAVLWPVNLDSDFRYFNGLWLGVGPLIIPLIPRIERRRETLQALALMVFVGGVGRVVSIVQHGPPRVRGGRGGGIALPVAASLAAHAGDAFRKRRCVIARARTTFFQRQPRFLC
jgi:hypothetical protein